MEELHFAGLPAELLAHSLGYLGDGELSRARLVCRVFNSAATHLLQVRIRTCPAKWQPRLARSVCSGKLTVVKGFLKLGVHPSSLIKDGRPFLFGVVENGGEGDGEVAKVLIQSPQTDLRLKYGGETLLHAALRKERWEVARLLIERDPLLVNVKDTSGKTPLLVAAEYDRPDRPCPKELLLELIERTTDLDCKARHASAIHLLVIRNNTHAVQALIDRGADIELPGFLGLKPLMYCCKAGSDEDMCPMIRVLLAGRADVHARARGGATALSRFAAEGMVGEMMQLIRSGAHPDGCSETPVGSRPLWAAVRSGQADAALLLIEQGASTKEVDEQGRSLLGLASERGHAHLIEPLASFCLDPSELGTSTSPLELACSNPDGLATLKTLLLIGATVDRAQENTRQSLLYCAIDKEATECAAHLLREDLASADQTVDGVTLIELAVTKRCDAILRELAKYLAKPLTVSLHDVVSWASVETLERLVEGGADIHARDAKGRTPLVSYLLKGPVEYLSLESFERLLDTLADETVLTATDGRGNTLLHAALRSRRPAGQKLLICQALIWRGLSLSQENARGVTPLVLAFDVGGADEEGQSLVRALVGLAKKGAPLSKTSSEKG